MTPAGTDRGREEAGFRAAPTVLRLAAGTLDLAVVAGLTAGLARAWFAAFPPDLPPRYWNGFDYLVDLANQRPWVLLGPVVAGVALWIAWQTFWARLAGNAPIARLFGLQIVTGAGRRPGVIRLAIRGVLAVALALPGFAGPLFAFASPGRRMLHDILVGCRVLKGDVPDAMDAAGDAEAADAGRYGPHVWLDGPRR